MKYITQEDKEKLELIDKIFFGLSKEELKTLSEKEEIVAKLKGNHMPAGPAAALTIELDMLSNDIQFLRLEIQTLKNENAMFKNDFTTLLKKIANPLPNTINGMTDYEIQNLKNRYGIYS